MRGNMQYKQTQLFFLPKIIQDLNEFCKTRKIWKGGFNLSCKCSNWWHKTSKMVEALIKWEVLLQSKHCINSFWFSQNNMQPAFQCTICSVTDHPHKKSSTKVLQNLLNYSCLAEESLIFQNWLVWEQ